MISRSWSLFFLALLGLDILTKWMALHWIPSLSRGGYPYGGIPVFADLFGISFSLNTVFNTGAAWGFFQGNSGILFFLRSAIIIGLVIYLVWFSKPCAMHVPLWLVIVGAVGNGLDFLFYGHVIDFLHFVFWGYSFPIFNLADCWITIGVFLLLFLPNRKIEKLPVL